MANDTFEIQNDIVVLMPQYSDGSFILGSSLLGGTDVLSLGGLTAGTFILGSSLLGGTDVLGNVITSYKRLDAEIVRIDIDAGFDLQSRSLSQPSVGTMNLELRGSSLNPILNAQAHPGAVIMIGAIPKPDTMPYDPANPLNNFQLIQTGVIEKIKTSFDAEGRTRISVEALDSLSFILNATLDTLSRPRESYFERMKAVIQQVLDKVQDNWRWKDIQPYVMNTPPLYPKTAYFSAVAGSNLNVRELLQKYLDGENGYLWGAKDLQIYFEGKERSDNLDTPLIYFSNSETTYPDQACYSDIQIGYDANFAPNKVTAILASSPTTILTKADQDSIDLLGEYALEITADVDSVTDLQNLVDSIVLNTPGIHASEITVPAFERTYHRLMNMAEVGNCVNVTYNNGAITYDENLLVNRVRHTIRPENWVITYSLFRPI